MKFVADPVCWFWLLLVGGAAALALRRKRLWAVLLVSLALLLSAGEALKIPARLLASREQPYLSPVISAAPKADVVIVLGGYLSPLSRSYLRMEIDDAADRLLTGVALVRDGKAAAIALGGTVEGNPPQPLEAQSGKAWIQSWELVPAAVPIDFLGDSSNTHDEAMNAARLAKERGWKRILLVTSAWHLSRAEATFRKAGLNVTPVGADFQGTTALTRPASFVPRTTTLDLFRLWAEETMGSAYYRLRGWS